MAVVKRFRSGAFCLQGLALLRPRLARTNCQHVGVRQQEFDCWVDLEGASSRRLFVSFGNEAHVKLLAEDAAEGVGFQTHGDTNTSPHRLT